MVTLLPLNLLDEIQFLQVFAVDFYFSICDANVITLTLLHPVQLTPVQHWTFEESSIVQIGRSTDNHVVLFSAVVSRYHAELRRVNSIWELVSLGANGTYSDGKRITQTPVCDGMIIRLARSGPNLQIHLGSSENLQTRPITEPVKQGVTQSFDSAREGDKTQLLMTVETVRHRSSISKLTFTESDLISPVRLEEQPTIGKYHGIELLSEGTIGITYRGQRDGQTVVLKTLNSKWVNHPQALALFERQATTLRSLSHPSIPQWRSFFMLEGQPYLVLDFIPGQTMFQRVMQHGTVELSQAIAWMLEVCDILDYLQQQSPPVVHQDICPKNLICREQTASGYQLALIDFGFVRGLDSEISKLGYQAPEQQHGQATLLSDFYAIGTTLGFLISGQEPSLFYRSWQQENRFSPDLIPGLLPQLVEVLYRLTEPNPSDRYQSAKEVSEALKRLKAEG